MNVLSALEIAMLMSKSLLSEFGSSHDSLPA